MPGCDVERGKRICADCSEVTTCEERKGQCGGCKHDHAIYGPVGGQHPCDSCKRNPRAVLTDYYSRVVGRKRDTGLFIEQREG